MRLSTVESGVRGRSKTNMKASSYLHSQARSARSKKRPWTSPDFRISHRNFIRVQLFCSPRPPRTASPRTPPSTSTPAKNRGQYALEAQAIRSRLQPRCLVRFDVRFQALETWLQPGLSIGIQEHLRSGNLCHLRPGQGAKGSIAVY